MASSGPNSPTSASDDAASGTVAWANPTYVYADDTNRSTVTLTGITGGSYDSHDLKATGFGFSIPSGATIDGILCETECHKNSAWSDSTTLTPYKAGTLIGGASAKALATSTSEVYRTLGGASDLWSTTWTDSDINNSGFGMAFHVTCVNFDAVGGRIMNVNHIRITVYYTAAAAGQPVALRQSQSRTGFATVGRGF